MAKQDPKKFRLAPDELEKFEDDDYGYEDDDDLYGYEDDYRKRGKKPKKKRTGLKIALIMVLVLLLAGGGTGAYYVYDQHAQEERKQNMEAAVSIDTFFPGITIDGQDVSNMTFEEAIERWGTSAKQTLENYGVTIMAGDQAFVIDAATVGISYSSADVIEEAFNVGRVGTMEERYHVAEQIRKEGRHYYTQMVYDLAPVRDSIVEFCEQFTVKPVDATIAEFDYDRKSFTFTEDQDGRIANSIDVANQAIALLESGDYGKTIAVAFTEVPAQVRKSTLENSFGLRAKFTTSTTSDSDRNKNIQLASSAVSGTIVKPGGTFSFNDTTGKRSTDKGYRPAGAINNGVLIEEPGGGVCQVSTTLFNAVARADLKISDRHSHSWPSDYVEIGQDAAVDYPSTDFQFKNTTSEPIYVWMRYSDRKVTCEIYGLKLDDGVKIDLKSEHTGYSEPKEAQVSVNNSLKPGEKVTVRKERTGQTATTYRVYYKDGKETSREVLFKSNYRAIQGIYEIGPDTPQSTPTPEPTETPEATETPKPEETKEPEKTEKPEKTDKPEETKEPEKTEKPEPTKEPEKTEKPEPTKEPEKTDKPEETDSGPSELEGGDE